jgi:hypothetical protein
MTITLEEAGTTRTPVLRRKRIGEEFVGALVRTTQRDVLKRDDATGTDRPVIKANGKPRQELVVTLVTISSTMAAGLGEEVAVPEPGDVVRSILKGGGFGQWIEANGLLKPRQVGDIVTLTSEWGQAYDAHGAPTGDKLTTQAQLDAVPRERSLGVYGSVAIRRATPAETEWVTAAETAYHDAQPVVVLDDDSF